VEHAAARVDRAAATLLLIRTDVMPGHFLTLFNRIDILIAERSSLVKTEVSIEYCVV
jgi:hypothetical protein